MPHTHKRPDCIGNLSLKKEVHHLSDEAIQKIRRGRTGGLPDVRWPEARFAGTRSGRKGEDSLADIVDIYRGGRPRRYRTQQAHTNATSSLSGGMKVTKSSNDIGSRTDRRFLKKSGTGPAKSTIFQKRGNSGDDGVGENILSIGSVDIFAGSATPAVRRSPEVGPDPIDPIKTATPRIVVSAHSVATPTPRRSNQDKSRQGQ